tara:strand:- start:43 stop:375 length:333 start_codon:yes stop_codon:yes gene_type:complete
MGNAYKRYDETLVAATPKVVLTVPEATTAIVKSIWVANNAGSSSNMVVTYAPAGVGTHYVVPTAALASKAFVDYMNSGGPLVLEAGDVLSVTSSQSDVYVVVSALLVDRS